jgi:protoheme IX farnesyltransferase
VSAAPIAEPHAGSGAGTTRSPSERAIAFFELTKPRITGLVLLTTAVGFQIASTAAVDLVLLLHALLGTALTAGGTNALNQYVERGPDAAMHRTRGRPLPSGRLSAREGLLFAVLISLAGIGYLAYFVNGITAIFAAATLVSYVAAYTPLKQITPWSTAVGGISGALPIVGGWTAATGRLAPATWALFGILFLWQLPHFLGLGWLCRDDYRRGGFQILAVRDPSGRRTATQSLIVLALLLPTAALPTLFGLTGIVYLVGGLGLGLAFLACGIQFAIRPEAATARRLFLASVLYLPVLLLLMVIDKV